MISSYSHNLLDRTNAYEFWVLHPPTTGAYARFSTDNPIIVKGGYLLRSVDVSQGTLAISGDLNKTSSFEIIAPAASSRAVTFNGAPLSLSKTPYGTLVAKKAVNLPAVTVPNLSVLNWVRTVIDYFNYLTNFVHREWPTVFQKLIPNILMPNGPSLITQPLSTLISITLLWFSGLETTATTQGIFSGARTSAPLARKPGLLWIYKAALRLRIQSGLTLRISARGLVTP